MEKLTFSFFLIHLDFSMFSSTKILFYH